MKKTYNIYRAALVVFMALSLGGLGLMTLSHQEHVEEVNNSDKLVMHVYAMNAALKDAISGSEEGFAALNKNKEGFKESLSLLDSRVTRAFSSGVSARLMMETVRQIWSTNEKIIEFCLSNQRKVLESYRLAQALLKDMDALKAKYTSMLVDVDKRADMKLSGELIRAQIGEIDGIKERFSFANFSDVLVFSMQDFSGDIKNLLSNQAKLDTAISADMQPAMVEVRETLDSTSKSVDFLTSTQGLRAHIAEISSAENMDILSEAVVALFRNYIATALHPFIGWTLILGLLLCAFIALFLSIDFDKRKIISLYSSMDRDRLNMGEEVAQFLHEMQSIANGGFNVVLTAREGPMKEVVISVNFFVMSMCRSMQAIRLIEKELRGAIESVQKSILEIGRNYGFQEKEMRQAEEILKTYEETISKSTKDLQVLLSASREAVSHSEANMKKVDKNTHGFLEVKNSLLLAMDCFNDTVKKSKEIDQCISLLNDVSDKTTVLALNAAIQASASSEVGAGASILALDMQNLSMQTKDAIQRVIQSIHRVVGDMEIAHQNMHEVFENADVNVDFPKEIAQAIQGMGNVEKKTHQLNEALHTVRLSETDSAKVLTSKCEKISKMYKDTKDALQSAEYKCQQLRDICERLNISMHPVISYEKDGRA